MTCKTMSASNTKKQAINLGRKETLFMIVFWIFEYYEKTMSSLDETQSCFNLHNISFISGE
jgi:hypothetical protein